MWKSCFRSSRLKTNVFEKLLNSFSCISFMKLFGSSVFCINFCYFSKILFSRILINQTCFLINWKSLVFQGLVSLVRLVLDWYSNDRISKGMKKRKEKKKKKLFRLMCSSLFEIFFFPVRPFLSQPIQSKFFLSFSSSNLQGFLSLSIGKT